MNPLIDGSSSDAWAKRAIYRLREWAIYGRMRLFMGGGGGVRIVAGGHAHEHEEEEGGGEEAAAVGRREEAEHRLSRGEDGKDASPGIEDKRHV